MALVFHVSQSHTPEKALSNTANKHHNYAYDAVLMILDYLYCLPTTSTIQDKSSTQSKLVFNVEFIYLFIYF